jgi:hypothetical protein
MTPHEIVLVTKLAEQLAHAFEDRGTFAGTRVKRVSVHVQKGPPVRNKRLPTQPPGIVIELPTSQGGASLAYVHLNIREGKLFIRNYLLDQIGKRWQIGPTWTDRFVLPAQALVAIHFGRGVPNEFVQQIADMY